MPGWALVSFVLNPWWRSHVPLRSNLPTEQCRRILHETTRLWRGPIAQSVWSLGDVTLYRPNYILRNAWRIRSDVAVVDGGSGTKIDVTFRNSVFVSAFMTIWLGIAFAFLVIGLVVSVTSRDASAVAATMFFPFGALLQAGGRWVSIPDRDAIFDFVKQNLAAVESSDSPAMSEGAWS